MSIWQQIKIWFRRTITKFINVTDVEKLKFACSNKQKAYDTISKHYYNAKGRQKFYEDSLVELEALMSQLKAAGTKCKGDGDNIQLQKIWAQVKALQSKIETVNGCITNTTMIADNLYIAMNKADNALTIAKTQLDLYKTKSDFTDSVQQYRTFASNKINSDGEFEDATKEIDIKFNSSNFEMEDMKAQLDVNEITSDEDFEKFKESL